MKKCFVVFMLITLLTILSSCWKTEEEKQLEKIGEVMEKQNTMQNDLMDLAEKNANWELSDEEYEKEMNKIEWSFDKIDKKVENSVRNMSEDDIPSWAKWIWLRKLKGLDFNVSDSEIIEEKSEAWFDGVNLSYTTSDYEKAISEAESLAKSLSIEESEISPRKAFEATQKMLSWMWMPEEENAQMKEDMWWAMFLNCIIWSTCKLEDKFAKMISVEKDSDKWEVAVSIINIEQWQKQMDKHNQFVK